MSIAWVIGLALAVIASVSGAFGTGGLAPFDRALFWVGLVGISGLKWQLWIAFAFTPTRWVERLVLGSIILNLTLPLEIRLLLAASDVIAHVRYWPTYVIALAMCLGAILCIAVVRRQMRPTAAASPASPDIRPPEFLARANLGDVSQLLAVRAEDHYLRLHLIGGQQRMIHYRFSNALADLSSVNGSQIHRGSWVAAAAVAGSSRVARKWQLVLTDGSVWAVSASFVGMARARGWLRPANHQS